MDEIEVHGERVVAEAPDHHAHRATIMYRIAGEPIPDSMARYLAMHAPPTEEVDRMLADWKAGKPVTHGEATWHQEPPKT